MPLLSLGRLLASVGMIFCSAACGSSGTYELKIVNGQETNMHPEVILLTSIQDSSICTGTFVSPKTVLTAAHCAADDAVTYESLSPIEVIVHPDYKGDRSKIDPADLALLVFAEEHAKGVAQIAKKSAKASDDATLVGYGASDAFSAKGARVKRLGRNKVLRAHDASIQLEAKLKAGSDAISSRGDSGGPLFIEGELAGVTSGGRIDLRSWSKQSYYANLLSPSNQQFLCKAVQAGASILGLAC